VLQVPGQIFALFAASRELVDGNNNRASRKGREDAKGRYRPATELRVLRARWRSAPGPTR